MGSISMRVAALLVILPISFSAGVHAQEVSAPTVRVISEVPGPTAPFDRRDLENAAIVLLTRKAPDFQVNDDAHLLLHLAPSCVMPVPGLHVCTLSASLLLSLSIWESALSDSRPVLRLWDSGIIYFGNEANALAQAQDFLDNALDEPVAAWRRLTDVEKQCWLSFLDRDPSAGAWGWIPRPENSDTAVSTNAATFSWVGWLAFEVGPCERYELGR